MEGENPQRENEKELYRIERRDYSPGNPILEGLRRRASVEPDKHLSMHPALRAQYVMSSQLMPLLWLVRPVLPGVLRRTNNVSHVFLGGDLCNLSRNK